MKELRFEGQHGNEEWRAAFAFDPARKAIILVVGAKQGVSQKQFYKRPISVADARSTRISRQLRVPRDLKE